MMKRLLLIFLMIAAACPGTNARITLDECRELARQNHPSIRMYSLISATRDYTVANASLQWVPSIRIGALGGIYNNSPKLSDLFSNSESPEVSQFIEEIMREQLRLSDMPYYSYKVSASVSQSIYDGGASKTAKKIARAQAGVESAETDVTLDQVRERVDEIYFSILLLEKRMLQIDSKMKVLDAARRRTASARDAGAFRADEADEMDAACIEAGQQKAGLERSRKSFLIALSLLTGKDLMSEELLMPPPPSQIQAVSQAVLLDRRLALFLLRLGCGAVGGYDGLRGGAALIVAALAAEGETEISGLWHVDRGYDGIETTLGELGADIERIG